MIFVCGMGTSGTAGEYLRMIVERPIEVVRDCRIPSYATSKDEFIIISYSGSTEETIKCFREAINVSKKVYVITSGGKLLSLARRKKVKYFTVPEGYQPRFALPFLIEACLKIFDENLAKAFKEKWEKIKVKESEVREIAKKIESKVVNIIVYNKFYPIAYRFKTLLNENAKTFAKIELIPEMNHNEVECYRSINKDIDMSFILIETGLEDEEIKKRFEVTKKLIKRYFRKVVHIRMDNGDFLDRIIYLTKLLDEVSIELGRRKMVDIYSLDVVNYFRELMGSGRL